MSKVEAKARVWKMGVDHHTQEINVFLRSEKFQERCKRWKVLREKNKFLWWAIYTIAAVQIGRLTYPLNCRKGLIRIKGKLHETVKRATSCRNDCIFSIFCTLTAALIPLVDKTTQLFDARFVKESRIFPADCRKVPNYAASQLQISSATRLPVA